MATSRPTLISTVKSLDFVRDHGMELVAAQDDLLRFASNEVVLEVHYDPVRGEVYATVGPVGDSGLACRDIEWAYLLEGTQPPEPLFDSVGVAHTQDALDEAVHTFGIRLMNMPTVFERDPQLYAKAAAYRADFRKRHAKTFTMDESKRPPRLGPFSP